MIHDIVLGDFGRPGTIQYLRQFEEYERQNLDSAGPGRRLKGHVSATVLMLGPALIAEGSVERDEFVGVGSGPAPECIVHALNEMLSKTSELLEFSRPDLVRIVIPCNTLSGLFASALEPRFSRDYFIEMPDIVEHTVHEALKRGCERIKVCGTDAALQRYEQMASTCGLTFSGAFLPPGVKDFEELYTQAILSGTCWTCEPQDGEVVVSGCTDVQIRGAINSVDVFARDMVLRAYGGECIDTFG